MFYGCYLNRCVASRPVIGCRLLPPPRSNSTEITDGRGVGQLLRFRCMPADNCWHCYRLHYPRRLVQYAIIVKPAQSETNYSLRDARTGIREAVVDKSLQYEDRLQKLGLWTLEERRNRADLIEVFKMAHGFSTIPLTDMFQIDTAGRTRGHSLKLVIPGTMRILESSFSLVEWCPSGICWIMIPWWQKQLMV